MRYRVRCGVQTALLADGDLVLGRSPYCSLVIEHASVSRVHAALRQVSEGLELCDLGSSRGTFVDGERITTPVLIQPLAEVRIGEQLIRIELVDSLRSSAVITTS